MRVISFITYEESENFEEIGVGGMGGFFQNGMRWENYIDRFNDEGKMIVEAIREAIVANNIRCTGETHQHSDYNSVPLFENNKVATYSYRGWGDLMAAIWSTEEDENYNYMDFYM